MSKNTLTVTLPDGTVATRTTAHAYTHVVIQIETRDEIVAYHTAETARQQVVLDNLSSTYPEVVDRVNGYIARHQEAVASALAGPSKRYGAISWHKSHGNAVKAMNSYHSGVRGNLRTEILPVNA